MKKEGGREAGYCLNMVSDRGNQCLFNFLCGHRLFFNVFPFSVGKATLIGHWLENRRVRTELFGQPLFLNLFLVRQ
jgi:hypothetical protein